MVGPLRGDSLTTFKPFLGKHVNVHLKDGSVIVNVTFNGIRGRCREAFFSGGFVVRLDEVAYLDELSLLEVS